MQDDQDGGDSYDVAFFHVALYPFVKAGHLKEFMSDIQYQYAKKILGGAQASLKERGTAFAPSNIALCKYWGKRDAALNLPINSSLSISLGHLGTRTELRLRDEDVASTSLAESIPFVEATSSSLDRRSDVPVAFVAKEKHQTNYFDRREPTAHLAGNLPHWRQDGALYFVTFRLADSLPAGKLKELQSEKEVWLRTHPEPGKGTESHFIWQGEFKRLFQDRIDGWLDTGHGECVLGTSNVRKVVEDALLHFDGDHYRIDSFVVMPNHVHVLVAPLKDYLLSDIVKAWKSYTSHVLVKRFGIQVPVWQKEYFDHIVRSPESLEKFRRYICDNPKPLLHRRDEDVASTSLAKASPFVEATSPSLDCRSDVPVASADSVYLNGELQPPDSSFAQRTIAFLDLFRPMLGNAAFEVRTENNIPTAAGLASSASGFAALVLALDDLAGWGLDRKSLSMLARLGSGSASRSVHDGFVQWHAGTNPDGTDSFAEPFSKPWKEFRIGILELSNARKPVGSRDGMNRTVETSELYKSWPQQAATDLEIIRTAIEARDFPTLGKTAERNALAMHATMMAAWPPLLYLQPETIEQIHKVQRIRAEGLEVYLTIDAGPNIKLLFLEENGDSIAAAFPGLQTIKPFW